MLLRSKAEEAQIGLASQRFYIPNVHCAAIIVQNAPLWVKAHAEEMILRVDDKPASLIDGGAGNGDQAFAKMG